MTLLFISKFSSKEFKRFKSKKKNIRSDHGAGFENDAFEKICKNKGIFHNFSFSKTPQQNGVIERKYKILQECARTLLNASALLRNF